MKVSFSVLMPAKNAEDTIRIAVRSTLFALPRKAELIVFNDGSTDRTLGILSTIKDSRLKIMSSDAPVGRAAAANAALSRARGKYIARLDADDITMPWRFLVQFIVMRLRDVDFSFGTAFKFRRNPFLLRPSLPFQIKSSSIDTFLLVANPLFHSSLVCKRETIASLNGWVDRDVAEDLDLYLRARLAGFSLYQTRWPLIAYRLHSGQISSRPDYAARIKSDRALAENRQAVGMRLLNLGSKADAPSIDAIQNSKAYRDRLSSLPFFQRSWVERHLDRPEVKVAKSFSSTSLAGAIDMITYRGFSAVISLAMALLFAPSIVGVYSANLMFLTLYQGLIEGPVRNLAPELSSDKFIHSSLSSHALKWRWIATFMLTLTGVFFAIGPGNITPTTLALSIPIWLEPLIAGPALLRQISLQSSKNWPRLMRSRMLALTTSSLAVLSLIFLTHAAFFAGLFLPLVDLLIIAFAGSSEVKVKIASGAKRIQKDSFDVAARLKGVVNLRLLSWLAAQADRLMVTLTASLSTIGHYSVALALSRMLADSTAMGAYMRFGPRIGEDRDLGAIRLKLSSFVRNLTGAMLAIQSLTTVVAVLCLPVMPETWKPAIGAIPILAASCVLQAIIMPLTSLQTQKYGVRSLWGTQFLGIAASIFVGISFLEGMKFGSICFLARDLIVATSTFIAARNLASKRLLITFILSIICSGSILFAVWGLI
jgi:glycosyltransferase involved in cell wall biosynthesis